jgi:hypothetical protein
LTGTETPYYDQTIRRQQQQDPRRDKSPVRLA